jgi:Flp pilus assembly pilin Flp
MKKTSGQSLTEYGLAIGLVVIIGIGGLAVLGSQTSDLLGNMIGQKGRGVKNLAAASSITLNSGMPARADSMDLTIPVTTLDGREIQISIKNYPTKITENDLLTGEDGGTMKEYALLMQNLAQTLYDEKVIDDNQFLALRKISNNGLIGLDHSKNGYTAYFVDKKIDPPLLPLLVMNEKNDISKNLRSFDEIEAQKGRVSFLADFYDQFFMNTFSGKKINSSELPPLDSLILDLSLKIGNGLELPASNLQTVINKQDTLENLLNKNLENINQINLKMNSTQMCGLGKGSVDEPKIKCIPSIQ